MLIGGLLILPIALIYGLLKELISSPKSGLEKENDPAQ